MSNERLVAADFLFGIEVDGVKYPLTIKFMDNLNREVCIVLFGEDSDRIVKCHSYRKGGTSSLYAAEVKSFDIKLMGR